MGNESADCPYYCRSRSKCREDRKEERAQGEPDAKSSVHKRIEHLEKKKFNKPLDEADSKDLKNYYKHLDKVEEAKESLGVLGQMAWGLWGQLQGQRITGFAGAGEIKFEAIEFIFKLYDIDEDLQLKLFARITHIDRLVRDIMERRSNTKQGKEKRGKRKEES